MGTFGPIARFAKLLLENNMKTFYMHWTVCVSVEAENEDEAYNRIMDMSFVPKYLGTVKDET